MGDPTGNNNIQKLILKTIKSQELLVYYSYSRLHQNGIGQYIINQSKWLYTSIDGFHTYIHCKVFNERLIVISIIGQLKIVELKITIIIYQSEKYLACFNCIVKNSSKSK